MGYVQEPPVNMEIAQAQDTIMGMLPAVTAAELKMISLNLRTRGTASEQEAFKLTYSDIRGIMARALPKGKGEVEKAKLEVTKQIQERILNNAAYNKFKVEVATGDDPLTNGAIPYDKDGVGPGQ